MEKRSPTETAPAHPLFESIGQGAENVFKLPTEGEDSQKLVEEIESMCINCEENVRFLLHHLATNSSRA